MKFFAYGVSIVSAGGHGNGKGGTYGGFNGGGRNSGPMRTGGENFNNHGVNNMVHYAKYAEEEAKDDYTYVLYNSGQTTQTSDMSSGLAMAAYDLKPDETCQVYSGDNDFLYYDTRGEYQGKHGEQQASGLNLRRPQYDAAKAKVVAAEAALAALPTAATPQQKADAQQAVRDAKDQKERSYQLAFSTLATARGPGGDYNMAAQPHGGDNSYGTRGKNWERNWGNDQSSYHGDCPVVALYKSRSDQSSYGANFAKNSGIGSAIGIVLNGRNLNWGSWPSDLCAAAARANKYLSEGNFNGHKYNNGKVRNDEGLSGGAIAGIVIGSVAFVVLVVVLVYCFCCSSGGSASSDL